MLCKSLKALSGAGKSLLRVGRKGKILRGLLAIPLIAGTLVAYQSQAYPGAIKDCPGKLVKRIFFHDDPTLASKRYLIYIVTGDNKAWSHRTDSFATANAYRDMALAAQISGMKVQGRILQDQSCSDTNAILGLWVAP